MRGTRSPAASACLKACSLALLLLVAAGARAEGTDGWAADPVYVYYPRSDCRGEHVQLEVWDREGRFWRPHPAHPRVPVDSCQLEDAGYLLNELRARCVEPAGSEPAPAWVVGIDVFEPEVMETCGTQALTSPTGDLTLELLEPAPGGSVALPRMEVPLLGAVRMGGMEGTSYDVALVIDRSARTRDGEADLLAAQVRAARLWLAELAPRLGPVRVAVVEYPNMPPLESPGGTGARRVVGFSEDPFALEDGLAALLSRGASGFQTTFSAYDFAEAELLGRNPGSRARAGARKLLVFVTNAVGERAFRADLAERLERSREHRIAVHLFAVGGLSEALQTGTRTLFEQALASYQRVPRAALATSFFSRVDLPWVTGVVVANRTTGSEETPAAVLPDGRFRSRVPVTPGSNRVYARATLSDGERVEREWDIEFDDRVVKELILTAEREHMRRIREKQLEVRPDWERPLPPGLGAPSSE